MSSGMTTSTTVTSERSEMYFQSTIHPYSGHAERDMIDIWLKILAHYFKPNSRPEVTYGEGP